MLHETADCNRNVVLALTRFWTDFLTEFRWITEYYRHGTDPAMRLIAFVVCLASGGVSWAQPASEAVLLKEVTIVIDQNTKSGDVVGTLSFGVHEKARDAIGNATIEWDPTEFLKEVELKCIQDDSSKPLSIGVDTTSEFVLRVPSLERIKDGQEVQLSLISSRPAELSPGVYKGDLKFRFSAPEKLNADIFGKVSVTVLSRGRRVSHVKFVAANNEQMRYGSPADVEVAIDTVDCELGTGELDFGYEKGTSQKLSPLSVPFPAEKFFIDPTVDLTRSTYPQSWEKTPLWTEVESIKPSPAVPQWTRHFVNLHLGDCDSLGPIKSTVKWTQDSGAAGTVPLTRTATADVGEGIAVTPRVAFCGEPITLTVASIADLGEELKVLLVDKKTNDSIVLKRLEYQVMNAEGRLEAQVRAAGQPYLYSKRFSSKTMVTFTVQFPEDAVKSYPSLAALNATKCRVAVWLDSHGSTAPLVVFASSTPFWWDLFPDPYKGNGWREVREGMWEIGFDAGRMQDVSVKLIGISKRPISTPALKIDADLEPVFHIQGPSGDPVTLRSEPSEWDRVSTPLSLTGDLSLDRDAVMKKGAVIGKWRFPFRMSIRGTSNGIKVVRIFESTATAEVTTQWVYYNRIAWWGLGGLAFGAVLYWMYRRANPKIRSSPTSFDVAHLPAADEFSDFMPNRPAMKPSSPTPASPDAPSSQRTETEPEPTRSRDDDLDGF